MSPQKHLPVLLNEVLQYLEPKAGESYLDATAGYGGHAQAVLDLTHQPQDTVLIDRDSEATVAIAELFVRQPIKIIHDDFLTASKELASEGRRFDLILADLGVSAPHLENAQRGFSIKHPGPLDMRMDRRQSLTASDIVNSLSEAELAKILLAYGEEPQAYRIAKKIVQARPIKTTDQLAAIVAPTAGWSLHYGRGRRGSRRIHPATKVFQAIRIAVNEELEQLQQALPLWLDLLAPNGRMVIISFHSLEDRIVKRFLADNSSKNLGGQLQILTKKPVAASKNEIALNPRARSAKLRAAAKIKT